MRGVAEAVSLRVRRCERTWRSTAAVLLAQRECFGAARDRHQEGRAIVRSNQCKCRRGRGRHCTRSWRALLSWGVCVALLQ